jgi:arylsulfatase A-like enzyme
MTAHATVLQHKQWQDAVKAYLACVSFVDAQVGKLLDALDAGPHADNTVIVLWGDHGWHLGEKQHWGKWTGWQRSTRVPLMVAPTRGTPADASRRDAKCAEPVSLLDLYPTLIEMCGVPAREGLSGHSLVPLLSDPGQATGRAVLTTFAQGNYSVMGSRWHYIRYADGSEELYDLPADPNEWTNLAGNPDHAATKQEMAKQIPKTVPVTPATSPSGSKKKKKKSK